MPAESGQTGALEPRLPPEFRHDILNDLNAVIGYATLLVEDLPAGPQQEFAARLLTAAAQARDRAESLPRRTRKRPRPLLIVGGTAVIDALEAAGVETAQALTAREAIQVLRAAPLAWRGVVADHHLSGVAELQTVADSVGVPIRLVDLAAAALDGGIMRAVCDELSL